MIRSSFIFLEKVKGKSEQNLWHQGIDTWQDFLTAQEIKGFSARRKSYFDRKILEAQKALYTFDSGYFCRVLPSTETWRLYDFFKEETLFLDIEIGNRAGDVIVIGMYDGVQTKVMIKGFNLDLHILTRELKQHKLLVTFNGSVFDIPVLKKYFSDIIPQIPHIDLRFLCQRLGLKGSLKNIELELGINRPKHLRGSPVDLWRAFNASGDKEYLDLLVQYNEEDIINLKPLMEYCYKQSTQACKRRIK